MEEISQSIKDLGAKAAALAAQAVMLFLTKDSMKAEGIANQVLKLAEARPAQRDEYNYARALATIIKTLVRAKKLDDKLLWSVVDIKPYEPIRTVVLPRLALAEVGRYSEAIKVIDKIPNIAEMTTFLDYHVGGMEKAIAIAPSNAIVALVLAGERDRAAGILKQIDNEDHKFAMLSNVVYTLCNKGKSVEAIEWMRRNIEAIEWERMWDEVRNQDTYSTIYSISLLAHRANLNQVIDTTNNEHEVRRIAEAFALTGDFVQALEIAEYRTKDEESKSWTLKNIVTAMAWASAWQKAQEVAEKQITYRRANSVALVNIGLGLLHWLYWA